MSILIKGMMMPKNCSECVFSEVYDYGDGDEFTCELTRAFTFDYADYKEKRHPSCPIIELHPHGRLIDADELPTIKYHDLPYIHITPSDVDAESYERGWNDAVDAVVDDAPVIIPTERGEE